MKTINTIFPEKVLRVILKGIVCSMLITWLAGCNIYRKYERPSVNVSSLYRDPYFPNDTLLSDTFNMGNISWQEFFRDDKLRELIRTGLNNNTDLQIARLRVDQAQAQLLASRLAFLPAVNFSPQGTIGSVEGAKAVKTYELPFVASWELDISGRLLNANRQSYAALLQSEAYRQMTQSSLIATIANAYYTLLMLDEQLAVSRETATLWKENVRVMEAMKEAGMTTEAAVVQSRANSHQVEASLYDLQQQIRETENALSVLLGEAPAMVDRNLLYEQSVPIELKAGIPVQLLSNRPDIRYAEMQLASAYYITNQARAAFYPQLNITGTAGWTNSAGSVVSNPAQFIWSAVGSLTQVIFNRGANIAQLRVSESQQEEALLTFQQSLLNAGQEVSDALYLFEAAGEKAEERKEQIDALEKAVSYTTQLFQSGMSTYIEILTAQQSLLSAQLNLISDEYDRLQATVNLYKALEGGRN